MFLSRPPLPRHSVEKRNPVRSHLLHLCLSLLWLPTLTAIPTPSHAANCTNPNGVSGEIIFNIDHKVLQFCNSEKWIGMGWKNNNTNITDGDKGDITVSNNGNTWQINPKSCPTGWTLSPKGGFCYSPVQPAIHVHAAQTVCKETPYADTCSIAEYYNIEPAGAIRWTNSYCGGTLGMRVTVNSGWECATWNIKHEYRCCMPNPAYSPP